MHSIKNKVSLIGNLGKDVTIVTTKSGKKVARFSIATNEYRKNGEGETQQETQWHSVVAWDKQAEMMALMLKKGNEVAIDGKLQYGTYQDKDGNTRYTTDIVAHTFQKLTRTPMTI